MNKRNDWKFLIFINLLILSPWTLAQKATLVEDPQAQSVQPLPTETYHSKSDRRLRRHEEEPAAQVTPSVVDSYGTIYEMRSHRRMAVGMDAMGELGLAGALVELNFAADDSALLGFGGGLQYSSFEANWRHMFGGKSLSPYLSFGITHWYTVGDNNQPITNPMPGMLTDKFLTGPEIQAGKFSLNFFAPAAGLQYNFLSGSYAGTSIKAEAVLLTGLRGFASALTGSLGALYYF